MSPTQRRVWICLGLLFSLLADRRLAAKEAAEPIDKKAELVLHKAADFVQKQKSFKLSLQLDAAIEAGVIKQTSTSKYSLVVARPNRVALRARAGDNGLTIVSDGKQLAIVVDPLKRYSVGDAPETIDEVFANPAAGFLGMGMGGPLISALFAKDVYASLVEGVTLGGDVGEEKVDGHRCRRLHFEQEEYDWDAWVDEGDDPLLRKFAIDPTKRFAQQDNEALKNAKMSVTFSLSDWNLKPKLTDDDFAFTPPAGFAKVDNLFGGPGAEEEGPSPLLGKPAPAFTLENLDGEKVELAKHRDKDVVILDFWATWCGPCRRALPTIVKVAKKYQDKGVAFYAVDLKEDPDDVRKFLADEELELPVILDTDGEVGGLYLVEGIPQTVLVGKDGTVQVVHIGLSPDLEKQLTKNIDDLLAGKDLAAETLKEAREKEAEKTEQKPAEKPDGEKPDGEKPDGEKPGGSASTGLQPVWSHLGSATGFAAATGGAAVYCLDRGGSLSSLDAQGKEVAKAKLKDTAALLRTAKLSAGKQQDLLTFSVWGPAVKAHSSAGELLWSYAKGQGVDDVCAADLNGDGLDEVVVGYNGDTGVHVLDGKGELLWSDTSIGNVWHVTTGNVDGDEKPEVLTTSAAGKIHVFSAAGKHLRDIVPKLYCHMIRTWHDPADDGALDLILVAGKAERKDAVVGVSAKGESRWKLEIPARVEAATACREKPWLAIGLADASVHVVDVLSGREIGQIPDLRARSDVAWLSQPSGPPLLIVATANAVRAYRVGE